MSLLLGPSVSGFPLGDQYFGAAEYERDRTEQDALATAGKRHQEVLLNSSVVLVTSSSSYRQWKVERLEILGARRGLPASPTC